MKVLLLKLIELYQSLLAPIVGKRCRFYPSCSQYMRECLETLPLYLALYHGLKRIAKCHPLHPGGHDPPPIGSSGRDTPDGSSH